MNITTTHLSKLPSGSARYKSSLTVLLTSCFIFGSATSTIIAHAQSTIAPPTIGQETKGTPAIAETSATTSQKNSEQSNNDESEKSAADTGINGLLGNTTITESRRDSGQRYLIELEHSLGGKQYIEETDSDGKIESTSNDIEETPNLPKWKLGSW